MAEACSTSSLASMIDKNYLECSICCGPFDNPRALPCLHPFCCGCLENWAKTYSKDGKIVNCPLCKKVYHVPEEEGIQGFPAHFLVADLQDTVATAKQKNSASNLCENHGEKKIYYCENCDCAVCSDCGMLDPAHRGHSFIRLTQAATHLALGGSGSEASCSLLLPATQPEPSRQSRKWKPRGKINTINTRSLASYPRGIAINQNGETAVTCEYSPVTVFSRNGTFKRVIKGSPYGIYDIAITSHNQYIIPGKPDSNEFFIYDSHGVLLKTIPTYDICDKLARPRSIAVDSTGRIIVGLGYNNVKTVSIHQPDGTLISKFETQLSPCKLTCTPDDRLIISFDDNTLQVMDQSGHNASIIQPPPGIQSWDPRYVCCSKQGELFVSNIRGNPAGVYRYRYVSTGGEYKYLDCIARICSPYGIALSPDEKQLFVVGYNCIKVFKC